MSKQASTLSSKDLESGEAEKSAPIAAYKILVIGLALESAVAWADPSSQVGSMSLIIGSVSFHPGSLDEWAAASLNHPLTAGGYVRDLITRRCTKEGDVANKVERGYVDFKRIPEGPRNEWPR
jgi:hypothetical protein